MVKKQVINIEENLEAAMQSLTVLGHSILAVIDENMNLIGVLTDGDIRRAMLRGIGLKGKVKDAFNRNPVVGLESEDDFKNWEIMERNNIDRLPIVNSNNEFIRFEFLKKKSIPNAIPNLDGQETEFLFRAINKNHIAIGPQVEEFESELCQYTGAKYAVATNSGSAALHLALIASDIKPDEIVITTSFTFAATANSIYYLGAVPAFVDIDATSLCLCPGKVEKFLNEECKFSRGFTKHIKTGKKVSAILPVHLYGNPADMPAIEKLAKQFNLSIIEDAAEALGAEIEGKRIGVGVNPSVLSFNGNKIITAGGGGMILTHSSHLADKMKFYGSQCKAPGKQFFHGDIGFNYKMPNINAAIGLAQAKKLNYFLERKKNIALRYRTAFQEVDGLSISDDCRGSKSSFWMSILRVEEHKTKFNAKDLLSFLASRGIEARPAWHPLHLQPAYKNSITDDLKTVEHVHKTLICLPSSTGLNISDQNLVIAEIKNFVSLKSH